MGSAQSGSPQVRSDLNHHRGECYPTSDLNLSECYPISDLNLGRGECYPSSDLNLSECYPISDLNLGHGECYPTSDLNLSECYPISDLNLGRGEYYPSSDLNLHRGECYPTSDLNLSECYPISDPNLGRGECYPTSDLNLPRDECYPSSDLNLGRGECYPSCDLNLGRGECYPSCDLNLGRGECYPSCDLNLGRGEYYLSCDLNLGRGECYPASDLNLGRGECYPASDLNLGRGECYPSSDLNLGRGECYPSCDLNLGRGECYPSSDLNLGRGECYPSSDLNLGRGECYPTSDLNLPRDECYPASDLNLGRGECYPSCDLNLGRGECYPSSDLNLGRGECYPSSDLNLGRGECYPTSDLNLPRDECYPASDLNLGRGECYPASDLNHPRGECHLRVCCAAVPLSESCVTSILSDAAHDGTTPRPAQHQYRHCRLHHHLQRRRNMDSTWLGLDDFFTSSSRRSRVSLHSTTRRSRLGSVADRIKIDFGPTDIDLDFDTSAFRRSLLREFDSFPRKPGSKLNKAASKQESKGEKENVAESVKSETEFDPVRELRELRLKLQSSQEENSKLQAVITDLTQVNKRWQKYNNERQIYEQKLLNTIQDMQDQLNHLGKRPYSSPPSTPPFNAQSSPVANHSPSHSPNEDEVLRIRGVEQKLKEKVSILEFQVKAHRDDWEAERNEKKQALKDKEAVDLKLAELLAEMQPVGERREGRVELYCQNCGQVREFDRSPPSRSRMYRTAVHLPCSSVSSYHSSSTSISTTGDEFVIDSSGMIAEADDHNHSDKAIWNIKADETSYSRSSTVPLVARPSPTPVPVTVKSFVQIPVVKSSSMPEGKASKVPELPRMSLDSLEYSTNVPPVSTVHSSDQYAGVETLSAENVICLRCGQIFPPEMHLKFLDHFPKCQSYRRLNSVSKDNLPKV